MQEENKFGEFSPEKNLEKQFRDEESEKVLDALANFPLNVPPVELEVEDTPIALPEPHYDGPIALMERGRELMLAAHGANINTALRSWKIQVEQWWADCNDWAEANPNAGN